MKRLKFLHIPKTAGTSIEETAHAHGINWGMFDDTFKKNHRESLGDPWHLPLHFLSNYEELLATYDFFTVVRNPWDLVRSEVGWYWRCENKTPNAADLNDVIHRFLSMEHRHGHWCPQTNYVYHNDKPLIKHVLRYEDLPHAFDKLMSEYGLPLKLEQHLAKGSREFGFADMYPSTKDLIRKYYHQDFVNFGYNEWP